MNPENKKLNQLTPQPEPEKSPYYFKVGEKILIRDALFKVKSVKHNELRLRLISRR